MHVSNLPHFHIGHHPTRLLTISSWILEWNRIYFIDGLYLEMRTFVPSMHVISLRSNCPPKLFGRVLSYWAWAAWHKGSDCRYTWSTSRFVEVVNGYLPFHFIPFCVSFKMPWFVGSCGNTRNCEAIGAGRLTGWVALLAVYPDCLHLGDLASGRRLDSRSRMTGDCHVRFCEGLKGKFLWSTRLWQICRGSEIARWHLDACGMGIRYWYLYFMADLKSCV